MKRARPCANANAAPFSNHDLWRAVSSYLDDPPAAEAEHGPIAEWDVSKVTDMRNMFSGAEAFNGDLSAWDTSSAVNMSRMFHRTRTRSKAI